MKASRGAPYALLELGSNSVKLAPARREVYLSGLVVLERIAWRCRVMELHHAGDAVRDGLAHRLVRTLRTRDVDLHSSVLLHTRSW